MDGLPFLPGNSFRDPTMSKFHVSQTLGYKNGYAIPRRPLNGIGGVALPFERLSESELAALANYKPTLTYGQAKQAPPEDFVPAHVAWDKKVLKYSGYFKQTVTESPSEYYRVRHIDIYYYLEDDSIAVVEPPVNNSGIPQGKLLRRQRLPKDDFGTNWHWKDINTSQNVCFYGKIFRVTSCDEFTKNFLESEGIVVNPFEQVPADPYIKKRIEEAALKTYKTPNAFDKLKQFIEMDGKVLRYFAVWDDRDNPFGELRPVIIHFYLVDDTLEVRDVHEPNDGRDPFPILIQRHKVPVNRDDVPSTFPAIVLELSDHEIKRRFDPRDFQVGKTVVIYGRRFLIYDIDNFTKAFYYQHFGVTEFPKVDVEVKGRKLPKSDIAPYDNIGTLEDSMQSCLTLIPEPPKKDFIKMMENDRQLRFEAELDSFNPDDRFRRFIVSYYLSDDMVSIFEPPTRNSGIIGGKFLEKTRVCKPGSTPEKPFYYGPNDFKIGAIVQVFGHRFRITNADEFVLAFMEDHSGQFSPDTIESVRQKLGEQIKDKEQKKGGPVKILRSPGDLDRLVVEMKSQLKKMAIIDKQRMDEMFLKYDRSRQGFIDVQQLGEMCRRLQLPAEPDVMQAIVDDSGSDGKINLEQFREFFGR